MVSSVGVSVCCCLLTMQLTYPWQVSLLFSVIVFSAAANRRQSRQNKSNIFPEDLYNAACSVTTLQGEHGLHRGRGVIKYKNESDYIIRCFYIYRYRACRGSYMRAGKVTNGIRASHVDESGLLRPFLLTFKL